MIRNDDIEISSKHLVLRVVAFAAFFVLAVTFITMGVTRMGKQEPGLRDITAPADDALPLYQLGVSFRYEFTGSSAEIKVAQETLTGVYTTAMKESYRLLDPVHTYETGSNLASLNQNPGQIVTVSPELYAILRDALSKTQAGEGYNLFAGALYGQWELLRYALEPALSDPLTEPDMAARMQRLREATLDLTNFSLEFLDDEACTVRFTVDASYLALLTELELPELPVLDLGILRDAYRLEYLARRLAEQGYDKGYLSAESGVSLALAGYEGGELCLFGPTDRGAVSAATCPLTPGRRASLMRAFPLEEEEPGYYALELDGKTFLRHPYLPADGTYRELVSAALAVSDETALPDLCLLTLQAFSCDSRADLPAPAAADDLAVIFRDEPTVVYTAGSRIQPNADYSFTAAPLF